MDETFTRNIKSRRWRGNKYGTQTEGTNGKRGGY
jgi:hypothetical protein